MHRLDLLATHLNGQRRRIDYENSLFKLQMQIWEIEYLSVILKKVHYVSLTRYKTPAHMKLCFHLDLLNLLHMGNTTWSSSTHTVVIFIYILLCVVIYDNFENGDKSVDHSCAEESAYISGLQTGYAMWVFQ